MSLSLSWTQGQCNNPKKPFSARDVPVKYGTATLDPSFIVWQSHLCKPNLVHVHILCTYMDPIYHTMLVKWHELFRTFLLTAYIRSSYLHWTPIRHLSISL
ncbi:hypothetical protein SNK03_000833 [Fusarium graminearum]